MLVFLQVGSSFDLCIFSSLLDHCCRNVFRGCTVNSHVLSHTFALTLCQRNFKDTSILRSSPRHPAVDMRRKSITDTADKLHYPVCFEPTANCHFKDEVRVYSVILPSDIKVRLPSLYDHTLGLIG